MSSALRRMLLVNVACMTGATLFMFLNAYLLGHSLHEWHVGLCDAGFWIVSVMLQPWLGPQLDSRGRVVFLRVGLALLILTALGYAYVPPCVQYIFPLRVLNGVGFALYHTAAWAWLSDHAPPEEMHTIFGIFGVSSLVGSVIGPVAANIIRHDQPPHQDRPVFFVAAAVFSLAFTIVLTLKDGPRDLDKSSDSGEQSLYKLARRPRLLGPLLSSISFGLAVGSLFAFAAAYLVSIGVQSVSGLFVVLTLVAGIGRGSCGKLSKRFGAAPLVAPCLMSLALGIAGLGGLQWFPRPPLAFVLLAGAVAGIGYGLVYPLLNALAYERLAASERGRGVSLVAGCIDGGNAMGAALAGAIAFQYGFGDMFLIMAGVVALLAVFARVADRQ